MNDIIKGANLGCGLVFGVLSGFALVDWIGSALRYVIAYGLTFI